MSQISNGASRSLTFFQQKRGFFTTVTPNAVLSSSADQLTKVDTLIDERIGDFSLLNQYHARVESELTYTYTAFENGFPVSYSKEEIGCLILLCYFYAGILHRYYGYKTGDDSDKKHPGYRDPQKSQKYAEEREALKNLLVKITEEAKNTQKTIPQKIQKDFLDWFLSLWRVSSLRNLIPFFNIYRMYFIFCRFFIEGMIDFLSKKGLFQKWTDFDPIEPNNYMGTPMAVFNILSIAFFAARFAINFGILIKHVFFPSNDEKTLKLKERFFQEVRSYAFDFLNDVAWGLVNFFTNYAQYVGIADATANWLIAGFLIFDILLCTTRLLKSKSDYKKLIKAYEQENRSLEAVCYQHPGELSLDKQKKLTEGQRLQALIESKSAEASLYSNVTAALLMFSGFTVSLLLSTGSFFIPICNVVCAIAVAMYISDRKFSVYRKASLTLKHADDMGISHEQKLILHKEKRDALKACFRVVTKNTLVPLLIVSAMAIYWPAAIGLVVLYVGLELIWKYREKPVRPDFKFWAQDALADDSRARAEPNEQNRSAQNGSLPRVSSLGQFRAAGDGAVEANAAGVFPVSDTPTFPQMVTA